MARELDPTLEQYYPIYDNPVWTRNMCRVLAGAVVHIEICQEAEVETALEHETFEGRFDVQEILNWIEENRLAYAYMAGLVETISDLGKERLLQWAVSFLDYAYQTPDIFVFTETFEQFLNYYNLTQYTDNYEIEEEE